MSQKQPKIFYGWYILAVSMVGSFMAASTSPLFMSIMLKPLTGEFGWSRTATAGAIAAGSIMAGFFSFPFGRLADRYGPRLLTALGALATAIAFFTIAQLNNLWMFYVVYVTGRIFSINAVAGIIPKTAVVNWFRRYRGRALGLLSTAIPLGSSVLVIIAQLIMEKHGWRTVFILLALAMILLQLIPALLVLRRRPEDMGLVPDGFKSARATPGTYTQTLLEKEFGWTLSEAFRTPSLWIIIFTSFVVPVIGGGIGFHLVAYYTDMGIAATIAAGAVSIYAFSGAMASLIWGFLSERFPEKFLAATVMILTAATILYLQTIRTPVGTFVFAVLFGLTNRGATALLNIMTAQYFGRSSFGSISGFIVIFYRIGLGLGPIISSISFDFTGAYQSVFNFYMTISIITAALLLLAKKPRPPVRAP